MDVTTVMKTKSNWMACERWENGESQQNWKKLALKDNEVITKERSGIMG